LKRHQVRIQTSRSIQSRARPIKIRETWSGWLLYLLSFSLSNFFSLAALIFSRKMQATTYTGTTPTAVVRIAPTKIILPDLVSHCSFDIKINRHRKQATAASKKWLFRGDTNLTLKKRRSFHGLKAGLLTSMCCTSLTTFVLQDLFNLDNLSDDMDMTGTQTTADVVMNSLYHPNTYHTSSRVGRMTKEYVNIILSISLPYLRSSTQLLATALINVHSRTPTALRGDI
jgi:hypothetical protein